MRQTRSRHCPVYGPLTAARVICSSAAMGRYRWPVFLQAKGGKASGDQDAALKIVGIGVDVPWSV